MCDYPAQRRLLCRILLREGQIGLDSNAISVPIPWTTTQYSFRVIMYPVSTAQRPTSAYWQAPFTISQISWAENCRGTLRRSPPQHPTPPPSMPVVIQHGFRGRPRGPEAEKGTVNRPIGWLKHKTLLDPLSSEPCAFRLQPRNRDRLNHGSQPQHTQVC